MPIVMLFLEIRKLKTKNGKTVKLRSNWILIGNVFLIARINPIALFTRNRGKLVFKNKLLIFSFFCASENHPTNMSHMFF